MTGGIVVFVIFSLIGGFLASYCTGEYKDLHTLYFVLVFPTIGVISYYCGEFIGYLKDIRHELNVIRECKTKDVIDHLKDISYELNFIREYFT